MSHYNKADKMNELRARMEQLEEARINQERNARMAKFSDLMQLAIMAMRSNRERTWNNKQGSVDATKKAELDRKVKEDGEAFVKAYRQIVRNDLKRRWGAELQKEYIQGAPEALLVFYLSDSPEKTKPMACSLKKAADDYVRGWEMLGKKNRKELPGPIEVVGNGDLAVQILIEQLKTEGEIQKTLAQLLELAFEDPISAIGKKAPEITGFPIGEVIREVLRETSHE